MDRTRLELLTEKERDVLRLFSKGFDVKASARELSITDGSVTERLRKSREKLGVTSSREAARIFAQFDPAPHRFSGDRISGIAAAQFHQPPLPSSDSPAGVSGSTPFAVREHQARFVTFPRFASSFDRLPLRPSGEVRNSLDKRERLVAIMDVSTKLAGIFALVCLIAVLVNLLTERL